MTPLIGLAALTVALAAVGVWVIRVEAHAPETAARRRRETAARIEALRLEQLEELWRQSVRDPERRR